MANTIGFVSKGNGTTAANGLLNFVFDAFEVTAKTNDGPTEIKYYRNGLAGILVATITIVYDIDGDIETVVRT